MKSTALLLFLIGLAALLPALEVRDGSGAAVTVPATPVAVASLTLMTDEFVADLLPPSRILAYSRSADDPVLSNVIDKAKAVKGRAWLNLELLLKLKPDLILAADWSTPTDVDFLRQKGLAVYVVKTPRTWAEVKTTITALGAVLGRSDAAKDLLTKLQAKEDLLAARRAKVSHPLTVLEYNSFGSSMSKGTLFSEMAAFAGLGNASDALPVDNYGFAPLSLEMLLKIDPDWLVLPSQKTLEVYGQPDFLKTLQADPVFRQLKAVKTNQILYLPDSIKTSTSHAVLETAVQLQNAAYPNPR